MVKYAWLKTVLGEGIVKKTEMIVKKSHGYQGLGFLQNIFFESRVYFVTGGILKNEELFVFLKGCGVSGSHLVSLGGWVWVGSAI